MSDKEKDPAGTTQQFKAFARGQGSAPESTGPNMGLIIGVVAVVALVAIIALAFLMI